MQRHIVEKMVVDVVNLGMLLHKKTQIQFLLVIQLNAKQRQWKVKNLLKKEELLIKKILKMKVFLKNL